MKCKQCAYALLDSVGKVYCTAKDELPTADEQRSCMMQCYTDRPNKPQHRERNTATLTERLNADEGRKPSIVAFLH